MFDNIGGKIKGLAKFICWVGIIASVILGIVLISNASSGWGEYKYTNSEMVVEGIICIVGGSILSWVGSFAMYGFGELVENSSELVKMKKDEARLEKSSREAAREQPSPSGLQSTPSPNRWTCPHCGKSNPITTSVCLCGTDRPSQRKVDWNCSYCGTTNRYYDEFCNNCGRHKE